MSLKTFISDLLNFGLLGYDQEAGRCGRDIDGQPEVVKLYIANKEYFHKDLEVCSSKFNRKELRTNNNNKLYDQKKS